MNDAEFDFFRHHPDPMWIFDRETMAFLRVNPAAIREYGYSEAEFLAMTIADIRPKEDEPQLRTAVAAGEQGRSAQGPWRHRLKDGTEIWAEITATDIVHGGRAARLIISRNVTDMVRVARENAALLQRERDSRAAAEEAAGLLRLAGSAARLGGWTMDLSGTLTWSAEAAAILAVPPGAAADGAALACFPAADRARLEQLLAGGLRAGRPFDGEFAVCGPGNGPSSGDGRVRIIGEPRRNASGEITGLGGAVQDVTEQVRSRAETQRLSDRLHDTLESIPNAFLLLDREMRVIFASQEARRLIGLGSTGLAGVSIWDAVPGSHGTVFQHVFAQAMETLQPADITEFFAPLGRWFHVKAYPAAGGLAVNFEDVTARRAQEAQLALLEAAIARINDIVMITDARPQAEGGPQIVFVNDAFVRRTGYSRAEATGARPRMLQGPKTSREALERIRTALDRGQPMRAEILNYTKSGEEFWVELDIAPLADSQGRQTHWVAVLRDVTERKEAEARTEEIRQRLETLVREARVGIIVHRNFVPIIANEELARMFGYDSADEILQLPSATVLFAESEQARIAGYNADRLAGIPADRYYSIQCRRRDGTIIQVESRAFALNWGDGLAICGMMTDVTERREMEEQFRQAQRLEAVGQLTGGLAHDFNNLLTVILGNAEMLADSLAGQERLLPMVRLTLAATERGRELTSRLLAFSRKQKLDPRPTDVNQLLSGLSVMLERTLGANISIELKLAAETLIAPIDASQLENAVLNLAINARDAMPGGGRLLIETSGAELEPGNMRLENDMTPGSYVMLAVSDTGTGMDKATLDRAFEPFFTTKEVGKGSGLGLSMVFGFVRQSHGQVRIYSELGTGTTVKLYLPRVVQDVGHAAPESDTGSPMRGTERILLVEDDAMVRESVVNMLAGMGYEVVSTASGREALAELERSAAFDLLFTDVMMPGGMNGFELAEAAQRLRPDLPVLFTSGYTENAIAQQGRLLAKAHLLSKPYRRRELMEKLQQVLTPRRSM